MGGYTKIPKLQVEDLGTEGTGDRIALFDSGGNIVGYIPNLVSINNPLTDYSIDGKTNNN